MMERHFSRPESDHINNEPSSHLNLTTILNHFVPGEHHNDGDLGLPPLVITGQEKLDKIEIKTSADKDLHPDFVIGTDGSVKSAGKPITNDDVVIELEGGKGQKPSTAQLKELDKLVKSLLDQYMAKSGDGTYKGDIEDPHNLLPADIRSLVDHKQPQDGFNNLTTSTDNSASASIPAGSGRPNFNYSDSSGNYTNPADNTSSGSSYSANPNDSALQQISNAVGSAYNPSALSDWVTALSSLGNPPDMALLAKLVNEGKIPASLGHLLEKNPNLIKQMEQPGFLQSAKNFQPLVGNLAKSVEQADSFFISQLNNRKYNPTGNENEGCGPTSLAMAARAFGKMNPSITNPEAMIQEARKKMGVSLNGNVATGEGSIMAGANNFGLKSEMWHGSIAQVDAELSQGRMVIADGSAASGYTLTHPIGGHFILVAGKVGNQYLLSDPLNPNGSALVSASELQRFLDVPGGDKGVALWP